MLIYLCSIFLINDLEITGGIDSTNNPSDAEDEAMREYWDIKEIISVWEDR